ncbi:MAG: hypothetical protein ACFFEK_12470 [Candidatus Thorarchaeota archaeon]
MKIEIDTPDLEWGTYYRDEKCKELEGVLQSDSRYAECEVKRQHWGDENTDPFHVFDENREAIVVLEISEVDVLNGAELITYIEFQRNQCRVSNLMEELLLTLFMGVSGIAAAFSLFGGGKS